MRRLVISIIFVLVTLSAFAGQGGKPFFRNVTALEYNGHNRNFDIECDGTGRVHVANFEGLMTWDGLEWKMVHTPGISRITSLYLASDNRMWIGGYNVLGYLEADGDIHYVASDTTTTGFGEILDIYEREGRICFETSYFIYHLKNSKVYAEESVSIQDEGSSAERWNGMEVNCILSVPDQGLRAIATKSSGIFFENGEGEIVYSLSEEDGLCSNNISALSYDGKGSVWGATNNGLFQICLSPVYTRYGATDGLSGQVTSIANVCGTLFVGTLEGLFELGEDDRFHKIDGIDLACWQITGYRDNAILASTAQGLFRYDGVLTKLTGRHTLCAYVEADDGIFTGEVDGIYLVDGDGGSVSVSDVQNVASFSRTEEGLWAINYYGETHFKGDQDKRFRKRNNKEMSLLLHYTDEHGRQWHSGPDNAGLICEELPPAQLKWCQALDCYTIEAVMIAGNDMYVGGNFGLIHMDLGKMEDTEPYEPVLKVRNLYSDGHSASFAVAMDKTDPFGQVQYCYRLNNDRAWSDWVGNGFMNFGHMDMGRYNLSIRCRDAFGSISVLGPFVFTIQPPIYLKWYAILLYLLVMSGMAYAYFRIKLHKARQEQERLEGIVSQRTRELKDAQGQLLRKEREAAVGKLTKGLIDRILNPMNYINNFSHLSSGLTDDLVEDIEEEKEKMSKENYEDCMDVCDMLKTNLGKIEAHGLATTRILKAMEELLKERRGKNEATDMAGVCNRNYEMACKYFRKDIDEFGLDIQWTAPSSPVMVDVDAENISKCIMSMLSNSVYAVCRKSQKGQYAGGQTPVVRMSLVPGIGGKGCSVEIYDNGVGIEESNLEKIFDPFFTTKPTGEAPGVGLYLSQQVVQDQGGRIHVESVKDEFARFTIELA